MCGSRTSLRQQKISHSIAERRWAQSDVPHGGNLWGPPRVEVAGEDDDPIHRQITAIVRYEINARSVSQSRMYFSADPEDERFVTVAFYLHAIRTFRDEAMNRHIQLENRIIALHQRINALEKPWWKRW